MKTEGEARIVASVKKKSVQELQKLGYKLKAYSSGGDLLVQSFIATFRGRKVHGWYSHKLGVYEFD